MSKSNQDRSLKCWSKETLDEFIKLMGYDLQTLIKTKKEGVIHDLVYLATVFGLETGYTFVWYGVRR